MKSTDATLWRRVDRRRANGTRYDTSDYCPACRKLAYYSILHPVDDEVFGPAAPLREVRAKGWEKPVDLMRKLGVRSRKTLLRLRQDGLLESWVYQASPWFLHRAYRVCAPTAEVHSAVTFYESIGDVVPVGLRHRPVLDSAGVSYREGKRRIGWRGLAPALLVDRWVAAVIEHGTLDLRSGVFAASDKRPPWQKRRLFKLTALTWGLADANHRDAIDVAARLPHIGARAVSRLLHAQIEIQPDVPYTPCRAGARTQKAVRQRRLLGK